MVRRNGLPIAGARAWAAWLLLAVFVVLAALTAAAWNAQVRGQDEQAFDAQAATVGASVTTAVRRMDDLTLAARTLLSSRPDLTSAEFARWYAAMGVDRRFSGVEGFGYTEAVPYASLERFERAMREDTGVARYEIVPPGRRAIYCLPRLGVAGPGMYATLAELAEPGLDLCRVTRLLDDTRDSGQFSVSVITSSTGHDMFEVVAPVYRDGVVPGSMAKRRSASAGWIVGLFDATPTLRSAIAGQPGIAVSLEREHAVVAQDVVSTPAGPGFRTLAGTLGGSAVARFGRVRTGPRLRRRFAVEADGRWVVTVSGRAPAGLQSPTAQAALVFSGWLVVGLLAFVLLQVLTRGRARALRMVEEKTGQLRHQALHDALTGLPNRALVMDRAEQMLRCGSNPSAMFIDLDGFKAVNDTWGHPVGDELLRVVAARIAGVLRSGDMIGRLGGDEFVVLVEGGARLIAERILEVLRAPFDLGTAHGPISITTSIGIASGYRVAARDLLRDADIALYEAKGAGRDRYAEFRHEMHIAAHDRLALQTDLRRAIEADELFLVYQPILDLDSGEVTAAEALLRWQHATRGLVPPHEFIAIAEESGLIVEIGAWVLERACAQAAAWRDQGFPVRVSVNVSGRQLDDPNLLEIVRGALTHAGLEPDLLALEITETVLMRDADRAAALLRTLKTFGVQVAIDDFGTGYSSLAYLQQFPVDALKIDRTFVASGPDPLIHTLVQLGRSLGLRTIAEGIEDPVQLAHLQELGCDRGQGYLFAPPLEAVAFARFLDRVMV